jgi:hypothetical protein
MHPWGPPIACGYRRRKKNTTLEKHWPTTYRHTNVTGGTPHVATNLKSYFTNNTHEHDKDSSGNKQGHGRHQYQYASARDHHSCCGSHWVNSESTWRFCAQSAQFDTGTKSFHVHAPAQQHQKLCQRYTRTTGTPNYATTVCSLLRWCIRSPSMNKVPRAKSGSKLNNSGTNLHMERLPGQS